MMNQVMQKTAIAGVVLFLAACGGTVPTEPDENAGFDAAGSDYGSSHNGIGGAETVVIGGGQDWNADPLNHPASPLRERVIYFAFDDFSLSDEGRNLVEQHAKFLASSPSTKIVLEGHADERGTREYNIALAQQRADSVRRMMLLYGVSPAQMRVLSYGEEKPSVFGHDESSWSLNRRVEINYSNP